VDPHEPSPDPAAAPKRRVSAPAVLVALVLGAIIGGMAMEYWLTRTTPSPSAQMTAAPSGDLAADVAHLKSIIPTQAHTMIDVGHHWTNLWFAAEKKNWSLARFLFDEARQDIRWTILIRPVRQKADGGTVDVKGIFTALDMSAFAAVQLAIEDQNSAEFVTAYTQALDGCHSCHVASEKPFLRLMIPTAPASPLTDFNPSVK